MSRRLRSIDEPRWWDSDPLATGNGFGFVLHQRRGRRFLVGGILKDSPAAKSALRVGDSVRSIDDYSLLDGDFLELIYLTREASRSEKHTINVSRRGTQEPLMLQLDVRPIRWILGRDPGFIDRGGGCRSCGKCRPRAAGVTDCDGKCEVRCAIV
jgi:hypothetical protein